MKTFVYSLFLSLCFFSCDEPDTKGKEIINYYPYVDTYPVDHVNPIAETKKLPYLPGYPIHYNAGAVSYQNKLLLAVRIETFDRGLLNGKNSRVILTFADKEFRGYQGDQKIVLKHLPLTFVFLLIFGVHLNLIVNCCFYFLLSNQIIICLFS